MAADRLLPAEDVAEVLGMRIEFVYALARRDQIPHVPAVAVGEVPGRGDLAVARGLRTWQWAQGRLARAAPGRARRFCLNTGKRERYRF
jgi:hypothetical protein